MATTESNKQTIGGFDLTHLRMRPTTFTVSFFVERHGHVADAIRAVKDSGSWVANYLIAVADRSEGWQPADGIAQDDAYGEITLTLTAMGEQDAQRTLRKILERATM